ncbi:hypothetical protein MAUB1S_00418 [Mycolicibacterium aubagnense]
MAAVIVAVVGVLGFLWPGFFVTTKLDVNAAQSGVQKIRDYETNGYGAKNVKDVKCNNGADPGVKSGHVRLRCEHRRHQAHREGHLQRRQRHLRGRPPEVVLREHPARPRFRLGYGGFPPLITGNPRRVCRQFTDLAEFAIPSRIRAGERPARGELALELVERLL